MSDETYYEEMIKRTGNDIVHMDLALALIRQGRVKAPSLTVPVCLAASDWLMINDPDEMTICQQHYAPKLNAIGHTAMARHGITHQEALTDESMAFFDDLDNGNP